jgi:hypothetical protein
MGTLMFIVSAWEKREQGPTLMIEDITRRSFHTAMVRPDR